MDNFQVPTEQPTPVTPIQPIPTFTPEPPQSKFAFLRARWFFVVAIISVLVLLLLISIYVILLRGKTALGAKWQDAIWQHFIIHATDDISERDVVLTYKDPGKFEFKPSIALNAFGENYYADTEDPYDEQYSFVMDKFSATASYQGYNDFRDPKKYKTDTHADAKWTNNNKDYSIEGNLKLGDTEFFTMYNMNEAVANFFGFTEAPPESHNLGQWIKYKDEQELADLREQFNFLAFEGNFEAKSRDAKRLADMRQMASALELYYNDNNGYPVANGNKPDISTTYIGYIPEAALPPDGTCSEEFNTFTYTPKGRIQYATNYQGESVTVYPEYEYRFCLGSMTGGLEAGNYIMSQQGINPYTCPQGQTCIAETPATTEKNPYLKILEDNRLFNIKSFKGISMLNGKPVIHYSVELDKVKLRTVIKENYKKLISDDTEGELGKFIEESTNIIIDRTEFEEFNIWVGVTDRKLYKMNSTMSTLSVANTFSKIFETLKALNPEDEEIIESKSSSRDSKRLADIRIMVSGLELRYNDYNGYPSGKDGKPLGMEQYLGEIPTAPLPADGNCTDYQNTYWYTPSGTPFQNADGSVTYPAYRLDFCLGSITGGMQAGPAYSSPTGIHSVDTTPVAFEPYQSPSQDQSSVIWEKIKTSFLENLRSLPYDANLTFEYNAKNFGIEKPITPPDNYKENPTYELDPYNNY